LQLFRIRIASLPHRIAVLRLPVDAIRAADLRKKQVTKHIEIAYKEHGYEVRPTAEYPSFQSCHDRPQAEETKKKDFPLKHSGLTSEIKARILGISLVTLWLLVWEGSVQSGLGRNIFLPPSAVLGLLYQSLFVTGELRPHLWDTVTRLLVGFIIGAVPALWFGVVMGRNKRASLRYGPILAALGLIPVVAAFPLLIIAFGVRELGKWAAVSAAVFYPVLYCTTIGVRNSWAARDAGGSSAGRANQTDWSYGAGPWIFAGLKLAVLIGLAALLAAEMFASRSGLEFVIVTAAGSGWDSPRLYVGLAAAALVVYALWLCLTAIEFGLKRRIAVGSSAGGDPPQAAAKEETRDF
jgi:NitT/TauT family transport system permease protein